MTHPLSLAMDRSTPMSPSGGASQTAFAGAGFAALLTVPADGTPVPLVSAGPPLPGGSVPRSRPPMIAGALEYAAPTDTALAAAWQAAGVLKPNVALPADPGTGDSASAAPPRGSPSTESDLPATYHVGGDDEPQPIVARLAALIPGHNTPVNRAMLMADPAKPVRIDATMTLGEEPHQPETRAAASTTDQSKPADRMGSAEPVTPPLPGHSDSVSPATVATPVPGSAPLPAILSATTPPQNVSQDVPLSDATASAAPAPSHARQFPPAISARPQSTAGPVAEVDRAIGVQERAGPAPSVSVDASPPIAPVPAPAGAGRDASPRGGLLQPMLPRGTTSAKPVAAAAPDQPATPDFAPELGAAPQEPPALTDIQVAGPPAAELAAPITASAQLAAATLVSSTETAPIAAAQRPGAVETGLAPEDAAEISATPQTDAATGRISSAAPAQAPGEPHRPTEATVSGSTEAAGAPPAAAQSQKNASDPIPSGIELAKSAPAHAPASASASAPTPAPEPASAAVSPPIPGPISAPGPSQAAASAPPAPFAPPQAVAARPGEFGRNVGVEIARHSKDGRDNLVIRLDPVELGKIQIRIQFDDQGSLRAHVSAESPAALEMLRRDSGDLARALNDAGVRTDPQSFQFDARGQNREQPGQRQQPGENTRQDNLPRDAEAFDQPQQHRSSTAASLDLFA